MNLRDRESWIALVNLLDGRSGICRCPSLRLPCSTALSMRARSFNPQKRHKRVESWYRVSVCTDMSKLQSEPQGRRPNWAKTSQFSRPTNGIVATWLCGLRTRSGGCRFLSNRNGRTKPTMVSLPNLRRQLHEHVWKQGPAISSPISHAPRRTAVAERQSDAADASSSQRPRPDSSCGGPAAACKPRGGMPVTLR